MSDNEAQGGVGRADAVRRVRRWFEDFWNGKDDNVLDELLHKHCVHVNVTAPERQDREGWKVELAAVRSAIPDVRFDIHDILVDGDRAGFLAQLGQV